ncbi:MAG TPA: ribosome biogenesis GTP-binding protein YihA/YsxC [Casimicrobiaceae bacterium]|jgi:GTP-binding protein|nr:ribosome biogenesis GTP-binding protein YihA/YsxC [Casimicrobiaceae bacterium]
MHSPDGKRRKRHIVPNVARAGPGARSAHPFHHAEFLTTAADWSQLPAEGAPEVAFAGRSNAGKSSAINALANHTRLAFVSKTPGRTQHINFFRLKSGALLADLPGYGYAKVPLEIRRYWQEFLARYLAQREVLAGLVLVMDARRPLTELDRRMIEWFLPTGRSLYILMTKSDKLSTGEQRRMLETVRHALAEDYGIYSAQTGVQLFSAMPRSGLAEAEAVIAALLGITDGVEGACIR